VLAEDGQQADWSVQPWVQSWIAPKLGSASSLEKE
jgi:hypothetical protein